MEIPSDGAEIGATGKMLAAGQAPSCFFLNTDGKMNKLPLRFMILKNSCRPKSPIKNTIKARHDLQFTSLFSAIKVI